MTEWVRSLFGLTSPITHDPSSSTLVRGNKIENDSCRSLASLEEAKKTARDRIGYLDMKIASSTECARKNAKLGRIPEAKLWLKRKHLYESQKNQLLNAESNIETQMMAIDSMATTQMIYGSIKAGSETMKTMTQKIDVDDVAETMKDIEETMIEMDEISASMATPFSGGIEIDESDLTNELAALMQEMNDSDFDHIIEDAPKIASTTTIERDTTKNRSTMMTTTTTKKPAVPETRDEFTTKMKYMDFGGF